MATTRADLFVNSTKQVTYYSDFKDDFSIDPLTGDLILIYNGDSVKQSISNLILRSVDELPYSDEGGISKKLLFEMVDPVTTAMLQKTIEETINNYEKRALLVGVTVEPYPDTNSYNVIVAFTLINSTAVITLNQVLERVR